MPVSQRLVSVLLLSCVLLSTGGVPAQAKERSVGAGFNFAGGAGGGRAWGMGQTESDVSPYLELLNFELRLFPVDTFSIDLQWNWLQMLLLAKYDSTALFLQDTYFHFHTNPDSNAAFAVAPYVRFAFGALAGEPTGLIGGGSRVGVDFQSPRKAFGYGLYLRPGVMVVNAGDVSGVGWETVLEMTWVWYGFK